MSRIAQECSLQPTLTNSSRTLHSGSESAGQAGYDGGKRRRGSTVQAQANGLCTAVDTLGHLLAASVTAANEQDRAQVEQVIAKAQEVTGESMELAYVDLGYTGTHLTEGAAAHGIGRRPSSCQWPSRASCSYVDASCCWQYPAAAPSAG